MPTQKPIDIYYAPKAAPTKKLTAFISRNRKALQQYFYINFKSAGKKVNFVRAKKLGIQNLPALVYGRNLYVGVREIEEFFGPILNRRPAVKGGKDALCEEDIIRNFQDQTLDLGDETGPDDPLTSDYVRDRMSKLMARKPHCNPDARPSRRSTARSPTKSRTFTTDLRGDDDFLRAARKNNINPMEDADGMTPLSMAVEDGDMILSEYYDVEGRKREIG